MVIDQKLMDKFWNQVEDGWEYECWIWRGYVRKNGYGVVSVGNEQEYAHRISWASKNGEIPKGAFILHKCNNPPCVNPDHLYLGNAQDNANDRERAGRGNRLTGEQAGTAVLSDDQVEEIISRYIPWVVTQEYLAREYGVSPSQVQRIVTRKQRVRRAK